MKNANSAKQVLETIAKIPGEQKVKVESSGLRQLASIHALQKSAILASVGVLAFLADKTPMPFEERKNVDAILDALANADADNESSVSNSIRALTEIAAYYSKG